MNGLFNKKATFWKLHILGWLFYWALNVLIHFAPRMNDPRMLGSTFLSFATGFSLCLVLRHYFKRIKYRTRSILSLFGAVITVSVLLSHVWGVIDILLTIGFYGLDVVVDHLTYRFYQGRVFVLSFALICWSGLYLAIKLWQDWSLQKERTEKANALAQSAQLQMLRYQLNPHFLFNSLNSIRALIDEDRKTARTMITELAEFLRYSLMSKNFSDVPLNDEIDAIRHYFAIEKKRYEHKLEVAFEIDPLAESYPVLSFLIHPLTENAIKYGMQTSPMPLKIRIKAKITGSVLKIEVSNSGKWVEPANDGTRRLGTGIGLDNVRQRLENAFPDKHRFEILKKENSVHIILEIDKNIRTNNEKAIQGANYR